MKKYLLSLVIGSIYFNVQSQNIQEATFSYNKDSEYNRKKTFAFFVGKNMIDIGTPFDHAYMSAVKFKISKEGKVIDIHFARNATGKFKEAFTKVLKESEKYWNSKKVNSIATDSPSYLYIYRELSLYKKKREELFFPPDTVYMDLFDNNNEFCILIPCEGFVVHGPPADYKD